MSFLLAFGFASPWLLWGLAAAGAPVPTPLPSPFNGILQLGLSLNVKIGGMPAATRMATGSQSERLRS